MREPNSERKRNHEDAVLIWNGASPGLCFATLQARSHSVRMMDEGNCSLVWICEVSTRFPAHEINC